MLKLSYGPAIHWFWGAPLLLWFISLYIGTVTNFVAIEWLLFGAIILGVIIANNAFKQRRSYEDLVATWNTSVMRSDPATRIEPGFKLQENEVAYYSLTSQRYAERWVAQQIQTTTGGGLVPAVVGGVLFGGAGAVAGAVIGKKSTTGTATNVYDVVVVDTGTLTVTNQRFLFLGARNTVIVSRADVLRASLPTDYFLVLEYQGRPAGEMFSIGYWTFRMAMVRRANDAAFTLPSWTGAVLDNPPLTMPLPMRVNGALPRPMEPVLAGHVKCPECGTFVPNTAPICFHCMRQLDPGGSGPAKNRSMSLTTNSS